MWRVVALVVALFVAATPPAAGAVSEGGYIPDGWQIQREVDDLPIDSQYENMMLPEELQMELNSREGLERGIPQLEDIVRETHIFNRNNNQEFPSPEDIEIDLEREPQIDDRLEDLDLPAIPLENPKPKLLQKQQQMKQQMAPARAADVPPPPPPQKQKTPEIKEQVPAAKPGPVESQPLVAQKKGQSEFVSFVEPTEPKMVDKRRLAEPLVQHQPASTFGSNLFLLGVGCVMAVGLVGTVVAGGLYMRRRRDTPDDSEYAPYAGTGPGFKKGKKGDKGDETLAYKAQLHHYQQAKQKIICGDDAPGMVESEGEDDGADDENNFSVYECPGLAPTGDIEVVNPNFAAQP